jgi:L-aspartate oxidase
MSEPLPVAVRGVSHGDPDADADADVIVVGGGAAGLSVALAAARTRRVAVVVKGRLGDGATPWAQGGIAAAVGAHDSTDNHLDDTVTAGAELCHPGTVAELVRAAPGVVASLEGLGVRFDRTVDGALSLGREGGHRADRVVHAGGDRTGAELSRALLAAVRNRSIRVLEHTVCTDLLLDATGQVGGVDLLDHDGVRRQLTGRAVVLATGGLGQVYASTSNPAGATGDGLALALRAGATVGDAEFVQFHPTVLWTPNRCSGQGQQPLVTEALRGAGAVLLDHTGQPVMQGVHELADLAPRDVVASRLHQVIQASSVPHAYLDTTRLGPRRLRQQFPSFMATCNAFGLDPTRKPVPVAPGAHYHCGGVRASTTGVTDVAGLFAVGEVAWTGMHGANRLASNSLLEALATGAHAGNLLAQRLPRRAGELSTPPPGSGMPATDRPRLQHLMTAAAGLARDERELCGLVDVLHSLGREHHSTSTAVDVENGHLRLVALLVAQSALARRESRGSHRRTDHPGPDPAWRHPVLSRLHGDTLQTRTHRTEISA